MTAVAIELHAEAGASPEEVRWVVPGAPLPAPGRAVGLPAELGALVADGTLVAVQVLPGCIATRVPSAGDWRRCGPRVRRAVAAALAEPGAWRTEQVDPAEGPSDDPADDRALAAAVRRLTAGDVGAYVRSHGGAIELVDVHDGVVGVRLTGACHGCPASELTLRARFERRLREECPALVAVVAR